MPIETLTDYMTFQDPPKRIDGTPMDCPHRVVRLNC